MGRVTESLAYRVKSHGSYSTFVEIGRGPHHVEEEEHDLVRGRRTWSHDSDNIVPPTLPYDAAQEPLGKALERNWVPDTPSPFLHPAHFLESGSMLHMGGLPTESIAFGEDMALPPAFGDGDAQFGMGMGQGFDGQGMDGYYGLPTMMYDPSYGWCMPMDGLAQGNGSNVGGETEDGADQECGPSGMTLPDMPLDGMLDGQHVGFDPLKQDENQQAGWCQDGGMLMDPQGCNFEDGLAEGQGWGNGDGSMPMDQAAGMMEAEQDLAAQHILQALASPQMTQDGNQGWGPENGMQLDCHDRDGCIEMLPDAQGWNPDGTMLLDHEQGMQDGLTEGQWCTDGGMTLEQDCGFKDSQSDGQGWGPDGQEGRTGVVWRGKASRTGRGRQLAHTPPEPMTPPRESSSGESALLQSGGSELASSPTPGGGDIQQGGFTTVMLRNIPNKYTREMLVKQLTCDFRGRFDFVYLPIDFKNRCNVGYGFINFRTPEACEEFVTKFNGVDVRKCLPGLNSRKVCEVTPARVQGLDENVRRLRNGPVMNELVHHPEWMPLLLDGNGQEKMFPLPDQPCPPVKPRRRAGREDSHGGTTPNGGGGTPSGGGRGW